MPGPTDPLAFFGIIDALWCKWRHGEEWVVKEHRVFPVQGYLRSTLYCPICKHDIIEERRLSSDEADFYMESYLDV